MPDDRDQNDAAVAEIRRLVERGLSPLEAARHVRKLSRNQLGTLVDLSADEISRLEVRGSRIGPYATALSQALQVPVDIFDDACSA